MRADKFRGIDNGKVLDVIWTMYKNYCYENGYNPKSKNPFAKDAKVAGLKITRHGSEQGYTMWSNSIHTPEIYQSKTA